jgi:hypothetical protein
MTKLSWCSLTGGRRLLFTPLLTPQGEFMGVTLAGGGVVRLPVAVHRFLGDRLATGELIATEGRGKHVGEVLITDADKLGRGASSLASLPDLTR